ncbi:unnamed protein product [Enterobius vermicularis]|uniref:Uncharacterized protein n=1 Tax=Enterobius vermicularis TaxID=51028 RepID=A0A0N4V4C0_ENTVE|nr:unnamed protein product [Enterobius vermicularis]
MLQNLTAIRLEDNGHCYLAPSSNQAERLLNVELEELSVSDVQRVGGLLAVVFCKNLPVFFLKPFIYEEHERKKRSESLILNSLTIPIEERKPNCMDLLLDCGDKIGETNSCYTWLNGVLNMSRECSDQNTVKVTVFNTTAATQELTEKQWQICRERRKKGLRC